MGYEMYRILAMYKPSMVNNAKLTGSKRKRTTNTTEVIDLDEEEKNMDLLLGNVVFEVTDILNRFCILQVSVFVLFVPQCKCLFGFSK